MTSYEERLGHLEQRIDLHHAARSVESGPRSKSRSNSLKRSDNSVEVVTRTADFVRTVGFGSAAEAEPLPAPTPKSMSVAIPPRSRPAAALDDDLDVFAHPASRSPVPDLSPTITSVQPDLDAYKSQLTGWSDGTASSAAAGAAPVPLPSDGGKKLSPTLVTATASAGSRSPTKLGRSPLGRSPGQRAGVPIPPPQKETTPQSTPPSQPQAGAASAKKQPQQQGKGGKPKGEGDEGDKPRQQQSKPAKGQQAQKPTDGKSEKSQQQQAGKGKPLANSQDGKPRLPTQFDDPKKRKEKGKILQLLPADKQVSLFAHLPQYEGSSSLHVDIAFAAGTLHPAILRLGLKYAHGFIVGSNARCLAMLSAFRQVIQDFSSPSGLFFKEFDISRSVQFLVDCRPISISMGNAITYVKRAIAETKQLSGEAEAKQHVLSKVDQFVRERITCADELIAEQGASKIQNGDVILTYARSHVVELLCKQAKKDKKSFRVIVVDSRPKKEGKRLLKALLEADISCTYVLINAVSYVMKEVSKVFVGAYTMMANGNLVSRAGTAIVAMMAQNYHVPFIVCCETYKFTERVQLESISFNEIGDPDELVTTEGDSSEERSKLLTKWKETKHLKLLNLRYDLTPSELVQMVITEHGMVPPSSVSVILREYRKEPDIFDEI